MKDVRMSKQELKDILNKNRKAHVEKFREVDALARKEIVEKLQSEIDRIVNQKGVPENLYFEVPRLYISSYDRAAQMLIHEINDTVVLDVKDYRNLVLDEWDWKSDFDKMHSTYTSNARNKS